MANLKNLDSIWTAPAGQSVTVGNNRTIARDESGASRVLRNARLWPAHERRIRLSKT